MDSLHYFSVCTLHSGSLRPNPLYTKLYRPHQGRQNSLKVSLGLKSQLHPQVAPPPPGKLLSLCTPVPQLISRAPPSRPTEMTHKGSGLCSPLLPEHGPLWCYHPTVSEERLSRPHGWTCTPSPTMAEKRPPLRDRQLQAFAFLCWLQSRVSDNNSGHFPGDVGWSESFLGALGEGGMW